MLKQLKVLLKAILALVVVILLVIIWLGFRSLPEPLSQKGHSDELMVLELVSIVDVENHRIIPNQSVFIQSGRIQSITNFGAQNVGLRVKVIDGNHRYLLPGLWDMHNHFAFQTAPQMSMPLYIAAGVTGVRDMQGVVNINHERAEWQKKIESGELLGPRIIAYADEIVGNTYDTKNVIDVVDRSKLNPDTFIKIYSAVTSERYFALTEYANELGVPFAGHYPNTIDPILAAQAGQRSFEHGLLFLTSSYAGAEALRENYQQAYQSDSYFQRTFEDRQRMLHEFQPERFEALVAAMVQNNTYFCPTHITRRYEALAHDEQFIDDERLALVPPLVKWVWSDDVAGEIAWHGQAGRAHTQAVYTKGLELTGRAHAMGVKVLAGGDTLDPYSFPGFNIHDELEQLVLAGLTPAEALQAATFNSAAYFERTNDFGSVAEGKVADLILLPENPLDDIAAIRNIDAVVFNGVLYERAELAQMVETTKANNSGLTGISISLKMLARMFTDNSS